MPTLTLKPCGSLHDGRWHYVPDLGRTNYGDPAETLQEVNAATAQAELEALGVEVLRPYQRTWLCDTRVFIVDAYHPATVPYLAALAERLEAYPVLDEAALSEAEWEEGYCPWCGSHGLPSCPSEGDTCSVCAYEWGY